MRKTWWITVLLAAAMLLPLTGCGEPEADVSIFVMTQPAPDMEAVEKMEAELEKQLGDKAVDLIVSPLFSIEKLIVETAVATHGVFILNEKPVKDFATQGAFLPLDDTFSPEDYPEGVIDMTITEGETEKTVTGLYVIPVDQTDWFRLGGYNGETAYAYVPVNAPNPELAKKALKAIVDWKTQAE
ncbi:hypothetical protein [Paenibacillus alkalitolerans]|uniref:hypothetical protein n=1 Tax=Paenibacillus alkalitolerans TaxID=2799335 RepID=UPI0018F73367|nr:hypothetical protein [Paenibacillus alkalitolerans]